MSARRSVDRSRLAAHSRGQQGGRPITLGGKHGLLFGALGAVSGVLLSGAIARETINALATTASIATPEGPLFALLGLACASLGGFRGAKIARRPPPETTVSVSGHGCACAYRGPRIPGQIGWGVANASGAKLDCSFHQRVGIGRHRIRGGVAAAHAAKSAGYQALSPAFVALS